MYLAIDLWDKKCGLAIDIENIAISKWIIKRVDLIKKIKELLKDYNISTIIVGLPFDLYWKKLKQLNKTNLFIKKLKDIFKDKKIVWIDERFTSFEAKNIWNNIWLRNKNIDDISAILILESYMKK
jgi:putative Holliday junction resolvase